MDRETEREKHIVANYFSQINYYRTQIEQSFYTKAFFRKIKTPLYQGMLVEMEIRFNKLQQVLTGFNTLVAREMTTFKEQEFYAL